jgi:hypothetical protein
MSMNTVQQVGGEIVCVRCTIILPFSPTLVIYTKIIYISLPFADVLKTDFSTSSCFPIRSQ